MAKDIPSKIYANPNISKFNIDFDVPEAQTSNILVSGANKTGKSRLSAGICSILQTINWKIVAFDNTPLSMKRKKQRKIPHSAFPLIC